MRPGGEWGVHGVQLSVRHNFPRTYLLVQSRAPSWSRAQVENGSSETRTVRACSRTIKITPSIWLWGEANMQLCYLPEVSMLQTGPPSPAIKEWCLFLQHGPPSRESYCGFPWHRHLVNWFCPTGCPGQLQTQGQCGRITKYSLWRRAGVELHLLKTWGMFTGQRIGNTSHCRTEDTKKAMASASSSFTAG